MMKTILLSILCTLTLFAKEQIVLVVASDFNTSKAILYTYEKEGADYTQIFKPLSVNLGRSGLAWGIGLLEIPHGLYEPLKHEGDGKAPAGIFLLSATFAYDKNTPTKLPLLHATKQLVCVDDSSSDDYNKILNVTDPKIHFKSFEWMHRNDDLYQIGVVIDHNSARIKDSGSCIFLHVQREQNTPTSGCTAMPYTALKKIVTWLDASKHPVLIQIPKQYCSKLPLPYTNLECK